jgi:hypothetical protein
MVSLYHKPLMGAVARPQILEGGLEVFYVVEASFFGTSRHTRQ